MSVVLEFDLIEDRTRRNARRIRTSTEPALEPPTLGRVPRVAKLLALAHHFETLLQTGQIKNYAQIAKLGMVTRARVSQIMALLNLSPEIQEEILHWPRVEKGRDPVILRELLKVAVQEEWTIQRVSWTKVIEVKASPHSALWHQTCGPKTITHQTWERGKIE